jgi:hypothetical protein
MGRAVAGLTDPPPRARVDLVGRRNAAQVKSTFAMTSFAAERHAEHEENGDDGDDPDESLPTG